ncbi:hypothetical protein RhiirB3_449074, partial [Rhizophagus irregularis]
IFDVLILENELNYGFQYLTLGSGIFSVFNLENETVFWRTRLRKTKGIFGILALGNEKPKGTPDVWMMESK